MKLLRTLAWLRWRLLVGTLRAANRGRLEQASRVLHTVLQVVLGIVIGGFSLALAAGAAFAGTHIADPRARTALTFASVLAITLSMVLAVIFAGTSGVGETLASPRLLLSPIRRRTLLLLHVASALGDPFVLVLVPALVTLPVALAIAGARAAALVAIVAGFAIAAFLAGFSAAAAGGLQLLMRNRRRREAFLFFVAIGFTLLGIGPSLAHWRANPGKMNAADRAQLNLDAKAWGGRLRLAPPGLYSLAIESAAEHGLGAAAPGLAGLGLAAVVMVGSAGLAFRQLLGSPTSGPRPQGAQTRVLRPLPGLGRAQGALAAAFLRSLLRTTPARTTLVMTPLLAFVMSRNVSRMGHFLPAPALAAALLGPVVLLGVGQLLVNQFAFDGDGLARQVLLPISPQQQIAARCGASLAFIAIIGLPALVVVALASPGWAPWLLLAVALATAAAARIAVPVALVLAALLPKTVDPSKLGRASQPHQFAALLWLPLVGFLIGPLWTLGALIGATWGSAAVAAVAALLLFVSGWIARPIEIAAARLFEERRENLLLVASAR